ncbi:MAG: hypothetical protein JWM80_2369 [Cyanobacteria bacterium RYN_339]|nr:hypothetical protein [Cyanobacteria bacterium RYN_339]
MKSTRLAAFVALAGAAAVGVFLAMKGGSDPSMPKEPPRSPPPFDEGSPAGSLWSYLQGDFAGERLERATWTKYKEMVLWPAEPKWESAYVVRSFRVEGGKVEGKKAAAECTFDTMGELDLETYKYQTSPTRQVVPYQLEFGPDTWKIGLPMLRPHVGPEAAIAFLRRMEVGYPRLKAQIEGAITTIDADARAKQP